MTAVAWALQQNIVQHLSSAPELLDFNGTGSGVSVYDFVPQHSVFPYVELGQMSSFDWSTGTEDGHEHLVSILVWSRYEGKKEVQLISHVVEELLSVQSFAFEDHHLVNFVHEYTDVSYVRNQYAYRSLMRFRVVTESLN